MSFRLRLKRQIQLISGISLILCIFDIVYITNLPSNVFTDPDIILILNIIRILVSFIELLTSIIILIYRINSNNSKDIIYLQLETYFSNIGFISSIITTVFQWGINLFNTFLSLLLIKAQNSKKEKYISPFQIVWILVLGNIISIAWIIMTISWWYMKKYEEYIIIIKDKNKKHDSINGRVVSFYIEKIKNMDKYFLCYHNETEEKVVNLKNSNYIKCQIPN